MSGRLVMVLAGVLDCLGLGWRELVGGRGFTMVKWLGNEERDFFSEFLLLEIDCWINKRSASRKSVGAPIARDASAREPATLLHGGQRLEIRSIRWYNLAWRSPPVFLSI